MVNKEPIKITDPLIAFTKMQSWCAYQERSQQECRDKLYSWGLWPEAVESVISELISNNFLNEERFAIAFAGGKFRVKKWGRIKIKVELKFKKVPDVCIKKALSLIDETQYYKALKSVLERKTKEIKEKNAIKRHYKLLKYAYSRGFEQDLIVDALKELEDGSISED